jgi:hypothetical protein
MKKRERAMFVYNSSYNQKPKLRESEFFKKQKKNQKIRTKILIPSYCAKIKVREQSVKLQMVPPNMTTNESQNLIRKEQNWAEIVLEIEI